VYPATMDRLEAIRAFVAVATTGSFAEAARRRVMSPSAVTRSIAALEEQLGLQLFNRTTRSVRLTERGEIYLDRCRRILEDLDEAERQARGEDAEPRGMLTVTAPIVFGRLHVLPVVNRLLAAYPDLSIRLMLSDRNVHLVEEGVDAAVRIGDLADSRLVAARLGEVARVLVASPAYLASKGSPRTPADLSRHDLIAFEGIDLTREWRFASGEVHRVEPRLAINNSDAAIAAAEAGLGIARPLSYQVREAVEAGRLELVLPSTTPAPVPVSIVYPARRLASANLSTFVGPVREHFRLQPLTPIRAAGR